MLDDHMQGTGSFTTEELDVLLKNTESHRLQYLRDRSAMLYQGAYEKGWLDGVEVKRLPVLPEPPPFRIKPLLFSAMESDRSPRYINFIPKILGDFHMASLLRSFETALDLLKGRTHSISGRQAYYDRQRQYHCGKKPTRKMRKCWHRRRARWAK